uniref:NADH-ubiquinone oxidoreductase chain 6 n=1 Tax=Dicraeus orientalis TaxID=2805743 RepID=A0A7U0MQJ6_9MUSC|nr:NADH dehydrogenase subunit 6 [Dicraeus orientalis]QQX44922.1 NADH dehydrogenase subunit 6 [Dicraeus orientalis]
MMYMLSLINSFLFIQMNHPLAMGLTLLFQTIFVSIITGLITKTFWFAYILFLIFLGGMLVLFIYVTSLASNEMFSMSIKSFMISSLFIIMMMFIYFIADNFFMNMNMMNEEMTQMLSEKIFFMENSLNLNKLYNFPTNYITILLMNYLLITLIAIVKITKLFYGPLRMMN